MILKVKVPNIFVPEEREFQMYCALKLYKGNYISKEEAINMCGYSEINEINLKKFNELCILFEKRYIKMCGDGYADSDFYDDVIMENNKNNNET
jgi:hypothetical protein